MSPDGSGSQQPAGLLLLLRPGVKGGLGEFGGGGGGVRLMATLDLSRRKLIRRNFQEDESHRVT